MRGSHKPGGELIARHVSDGRHVMKKLSGQTTTPLWRAQLNGCWIESFSPIFAGIVAMSGGYDSAMIDIEHGPGSLTDAVVMMQALSAHQCKPMIRATSGEPSLRSKRR